MATLRKRHKSDENANPELGEEVQATLDFDSNPEPVAEQESSENVEAVSMNAEKFESESSAEAEEEEEHSEGPKVVIKRRRIVKKNEENDTSSSESPASSTASSSVENNHRKLNQSNNQNRFNKNGKGGKKPFVRPSYPTPSGEVSEQIASAEAAAASSSIDDNANKPRLLINDLKIARSSKTVLYEIPLFKRSNL